MLLRINEGGEGNQAMPNPEILSHLHIFTMVISCGRIDFDPVEVNRFC